MYPLDYFLTIDRMECGGFYTHNNQSIPANGTCMSMNECEKQSGISGGNCGINRGGICCLFIYSCGNVSKNNLTYFTNPDWPLGFQEPFSCSLKVNKINNDICQLKLDFEDFRIVGPQVGEQPFRYYPSISQSPNILGAVNRHSNCKDDVFIVNHANRNFQIPLICGVNTGQHMYIPVHHSNSDSILLTFLTGINQLQRYWKIKITQLSCTSREQLAPEGCLQYHTTPTGTVTSFNFQGDHYLQNIDYSICIKRPIDMCFLTFKRNLISTNPFNFGEGGATNTMNNNNNNSNNSNESNVVASATFIRSKRNIFVNGTILEAKTIIHDKCQNADYWLTWPGTDRICSDDIAALNIPITIATSAPQVIHFFSSPWDESQRELHGAYQGFSLNYTHSPCTHGYFRK
ncbi:uncharacterized protein B4U80_13081 [Leptotrombidium deliense]|uniref:CUB domain-containing protein n=1 Tax=Leptotrombidium deliense TaxID=299467 RepID=A0A443SD02_9ACAR|nr:uncharacterized protein B4U80_13081 [Leptotrombidium deliense]